MMSLDPLWVISGAVGGNDLVTVHNFSYGLLNPVLAYVVSCLGAFLGLRCVTRARAYEGRRRASWLVLAAVSIGATGIWAMHFVAMLGFTVPGQQILYNVPLTIASMLLAILVVGIGLFIVGYGRRGWARIVPGGAIIGVGVASMHYMGMAAMQMPDAVHYDKKLVAVSVVIAIVAGTAALGFGTRVHGVGATIGASLIMGVGVSGMHYTGMAAMRITRGSMAAMSGSTAFAFIVPLVIGLTVVTSVITMAVSIAPTEDEIAADAALQRRIEEVRANQAYHRRGPAPLGAAGQAQPRPDNAGQT
jgi:NO-binding membrane sensor protein with MHYT domain